MWNTLDTDGPCPAKEAAVADRQETAPDDGGAPYVGPVVCWICGHGAEERRVEVAPGECDVAAEWGRPRERCLMNSPEEQARNRGGHADAG